jgi:hypothetical protein
MGGREEMNPRVVMTVTYEYRCAACGSRMEVRMPSHPSNVTPPHPEDCPPGWAEAHGFFFCPSHENMDLVVDGKVVLHRHLGPAR